MFHFNCSACGSHPPELDLSTYLRGWSQSGSDRIAALSATEARILSTVLTSPIRWPSKRLRSTMGELLRLLEMGISQAPLEACGRTLPIDSGVTLDQRHFFEDCPLCDSSRGVRPRDSYFTSWIAPCKVQCANLLFDTMLVFHALLQAFPPWMAPADAERLNTIVLLSAKALSFIPLRTCWFCGRRTTALFGEGSPTNPFHCRWCYDWSGGIFSGIKLGVKPAAPGSEFPFELDVAYNPPKPVRLGSELIPWRHLHMASVPPTTKTARRGASE